MVISSGLTSGANAQQVGRAERSVPTRHCTPVPSSTPSSGPSTGGGTSIPARSPRPGRHRARRLGKRRPGVLHAAHTQLRRRSTPGTTTTPVEHTQQTCRGCSTRGLPLTRGAAAAVSCKPVRLYAWPLVCAVACPGPGRQCPEPARPCPRPRPVTCWGVGGGPKRRLIKWILKNADETIKSTQTALK